MKEELKLCYVSQTSEITSYTELWFTSHELKSLWGDDWDDAPYEHNAGEPYDYDINTREKVDFEVLIIKEPYSMEVKTPRYGKYNSEYTLEDITHKKKVPWLKIEEDEIYAGTTMVEVLEILGKYNGIKVYKEVDLKDEME